MNNWVNQKRVEPQPMKINEHGAQARFKTIEQTKTDEDEETKRQVPQLIDLLTIYKPKKQVIQNFNQPEEYSR